YRSSAGIDQCSPRCSKRERRLRRQTWRSTLARLKRLESSRERSAFGATPSCLCSATVSCTELQGKNRALSESLEQETATSEILRVISSSPTDVQPVHRGG